MCIRDSGPLSVRRVHGDILSISLQDLPNPVCHPLTPRKQKSSGTAKGAISRSAVRRRLSAKAQLSAAPRIRTDTLPAVKPDTPSPPRAAARSAAAVKATA